MANNIIIENLPHFGKLAIRQIGPYKYEIAELPPMDTNWTIWDTSCRDVNTALYCIFEESRRRTQ